MHSRCRFIRDRGLIDQWQVNVKEVMRRCLKEKTQMGLYRHSAREHSILIHLSKKYLRGVLVHGMKIYKAKQKAVKNKNKYQTEYKQIHLVERIHFVNVEECQS